MQKQQNIQSRINKAEICHQFLLWFTSSVLVFKYRLLKSCKDRWRLFNFSFKKTKKRTNFWFPKAKNKSISP